MDAFFNQVANTLGASLDQTKLIICLLVSYPLGSFFIRLPSTIPILRHVFSVLISVFYLGVILNLWNGLLQLLFDVTATYTIAATVQTRWMPWLVFAVIMGHLTINHIFRAIFNMGYETVDITGAQMVLSMKLTTFAWNVFDGRRSAEDLDRWQLAKRIIKYPSFIEFLGYAFYFPGVLVGPYLDYVSYKALINESLFAISKDKEAQNRSTRRVPTGRKRVAYTKLVLGLCYLALFVSGINHFHYGVAIESWFVTKTLWFRIVYFQLCGSIERSKYYAIWTLTEGASILTGFGFTGYGSKGESFWQDAANVNVFFIEFPSNFKVLLDSWNMKTNVWLRECVYKRVTPKGKKPGFRSSMITFVASAFWHGIAGGYYLAFIFAGFVQTVGRQCRSHVRPLLLPVTASKSSSVMKLIYDLVGTICCVLILNYAAAPFMLLTVSASMQGWKNLGWYGFWMIGVSMIFFYGGGKYFLLQLQSGRSRENANMEVKSSAFSGINLSGDQTSGPHIMPPLEKALDEAEKELS